MPDVFPSAAVRRLEHHGVRLLPGDADDSLLWQYVEFDLMPPDDRPSLSDEEKQLLQQWLDDGAVWSADTIDASALTRDDRAAYRWLQLLRTRS